MNITKQFHTLLPFITLLLTFLRMMGHSNLADITEKYITAMSAGVAALPDNTSTVISGTDAITEYGESILEQIKAVKESGLEKWQKVEKATELAATLSNRKIVYQPKKGADFSALNDYKARAMDMVNEISK